eukprot:CAMPEP_0170274108 /NCGR_PEP_ID=MMETSP0116_2-20130129/37024_1 /TAXON_ID=400756 /ORGANISM="Durinskia baltica, Strain CSIRO CS-38" /LENGTH=272 /DNA_ID=CAMNT_0010525351 /DNA_START=102 /DNA_END=920 /DNA_ORIENTATION=+
MSLAASGVAVTGATMLTHPIDVVKVRLQLARKSCARADSFSLSRFARMWPSLYRAEGPAVFFAGVRSGAMRAASYGTARIGLCEPLEAAVGSKTGGALISGVLATVVGNPFEVLKVRLQARPDQAAAGELRAMAAMVREEGFAVLFRGFAWASARSALLTASQVVPYAHSKTVLRPIVKSDGLALHTAASLIAGVITCTVTAPVDVMKTRVMSASGGHGMHDALSLLRSEGPLFFFKGWLANYVRIGPQTLFIFVFFEQAKRAFSAMRFSAA